MSGRPLSQWTDEELLAAAKRLAAGGEEKPPATFGETMADIGTQAGVGPVRALTGAAGFPGDIQEAVGKGTEWLTGRPAAQQPAAVRVALENRLPTSARLQGLVEENITGPLPEAKTGPGKLVRTTGEHSLAAALPARSLTQRAINVFAPAAGAEAGEVIGKRVLDSPNLGRFVGGFTGGVAGVRGLTPTAAPRPEYAARVATLDAAGVPMTAGQRTGSLPLRWFEEAASDMPGVGGHAARLNEATSRGYSGAVARTMGATGDEIFTPEMMQREIGRPTATAPRGRIPQAFEDISNRNTLTPDPQFANDLATVRTRYETNTLPSQRAGGAKDIDSIVDDVIDKIGQNNGVLPGPIYQGIRSRLTAMADSLSDNTAQNELRRAITGIRNALDDTMGRSIPQAEQAAWQTARREYANWKTIQPALGTGSRTAEGYVSPTQLRTSARARDPTAYDTGQGELNQLARAGEAVLRPLPQSGTTPRAQAANWLSLGLGAGVGGFTANPLLGLAVAGTPSVTGRALLSRPVQRYLSNDYPIQQMLGTPPLPGEARRAALIDAILGMQRGENK